MADRDDEDRRRTSSRWVTPGGEIRSDCLFWTSPRIRNFVPIRSPMPPPVRPEPCDTAGLSLDRDGRSPRGDAGP